ncbi:butyrophilin subfamily 3 member A2-like isoform X2 [Channa argus]|uniref:butyrophilin subfamily 3 member A2-like isoform X2 n=1 Tax=Channa argus TaxID=215402 RepID=UPI00351FDCC2
MDQLCIHSTIVTISVLVVHLLLHFCRGQSRLIGSPQPVVAKVGDDVILPCHLEPAVDIGTNMLEWTRSDLNPRYVYVWYAGQDYVNMKNPSYKGRTSLFTDELKRGNISLKLSNVTPADEGKYRCYIPDRNEESVIELVVGAVSLPGISLAGLDKSSSEVVLQCESKGWYPEPEVLWLDVEGNVLSAGPTETVRGPDDLYTVSSSVTVDKRHGNIFTCRVQQNNINQTRETHIHVPDDFFKLQSRSSATTVGLVFSLVVCIMLILLLLLLLWKKNMSKRNQMDEVESKDQNNDNAETELLTKDKKETKQMERSQAVAAWSFSSLLNQLFGEKTELEGEVKNLENKNTELEGKLTKTTNKLQEEKKKRQEEVKTLKNQLKELREKKESVDKKLMETSEELKQTQDKLRVKTEEFNKQLQDEKQSGKKREDNLQKELEDEEKKWENQLHDEKQRGKKTEDALKKELEDKNKKISDDKNELGEEEKKQEKDLTNNNTQLEEPTSSERTSVATMSRIST